MSFMYIFPFIFIGMAIFVVYIISRMGWDNLAERFRMNERFEGRRIGLVSISVNAGNYNRVFVLRHNDNGIYFKPIFLFRLFHPPVFIPWNEIKDVRDKKILFINLKELVIGHPFIALITMKASVYDKIEKPFTIK